MYNKTPLRVQHEDMDITSEDCFTSDASIYTEKLVSVTNQDFYIEDRGSKFIRNVGDTASHPRRTDTKLTKLQTLYAGNECLSFPNVAAVHLPRCRATGRGVEK
jgi:hypothetical protein